MAKVRSDSLYARLKPKQRDELILLLDSGAKLMDAVELCKKWGVDTSIGGVSSFYSKHHFHWLLQRAKAKTETLVAEGTFEPETARAVRQKLFEEVMRSHVDPKTLIGLRRLEVQEKNLAVKERYVATLEQKLNSAKQALTAVKRKGGMTKETQQQVEDTLKLL